VPRPRWGHDLEASAAEQLQFLLAVRAAYPLHLSGQPRDAFHRFDDQPERLEGDLTGLGGREDQPLVPQEHAGDDAKAEQVALSVLTGHEDAAGRVRPSASVVDDVGCVCDVLLPRQERFAEGDREVDEVNAP
jgi:hypothetical protein